MPCTAVYLCVCPHVHHKQSRLALPFSLVPEWATSTPNVCAVLMPLLLRAASHDPPTSEQGLVPFGASRSGGTAVTLGDSANMAGAGASGAAGVDSAAYAQLGLLNVPGTEAAAPRRPLHPSGIGVEAPAMQAAAMETETTPGSGGGMDDGAGGGVGAGGGAGASLPLTTSLMRQSVSSVESVSVRSAIVDMRDGGGRGGGGTGSMMGRSPGRFGGGQASDGGARTLWSSHPRVAVLRSAVAAVLATRSQDVEALCDMLLQAVCSTEVGPRGLCGMCGKLGVVSGCKRVLALLRVADGCNVLRFVLSW